MATKLKRPMSFLLALVVAMVFNFPIGVTNGITGIFNFGLPAKAAAETITPSAPTLTKGKYDFDGNAETDDEVYEIGTKEELYWFAGLVNGDTTVCDYDESTNTNGTKQNTAACAKLTADITVNSNLLNSLLYRDDGYISNGSEFTKWPCIGNYETAYTGTFDGAGYTISGLCVNTGYTDNVGLFGWVGNGSNIRNVGVIDSYFCGSNYVGGVCGYNKGGTITSCYSTSKIHGGCSYIGGVCGYNEGGTITDCYNKGEVMDMYQSSSASTGGVCGYVKGNSTITNCYNEGAVNSVKYNVGGVCGYVCEDRATITIENCYNTGAVTGEYNVGGVCGYVYHYKEDTVNDPNKIINCYNTGAVTATTETATANVGGVCGYVKAHTDAGRNKAENTIENCYNTGAVTAETTAKPANIGGVCGYVEARTRNDTEIAKNTITNCYYINDSIEAIGTTSVSGVGKNLTDKVVVKTQDAFASGEVCYLLNGSTSEGENLVWGQTLGTDGNASPVFHNGSNTVYIGYTTCDESAPIQYANSVLSTTTKPDHKYNNGFCEKCGNYDPAKYSDNNYVYEISNAGQLYWFAALVKGDTSVYGITKAVPSANAILKNDITVNEKVLADDGTQNEGSFRTWTPIGVYDGSNESYMYKGTFDGQGFTISGLYFDNKDTNYVGLFGSIGYNGVVKNINITDSYFSGGMNVGSVCGYNYQGTIENCSNAGEVNGRQYAGGVCGYNHNAEYNAEKSIIKNCYNTGAVTGGSGEYFGGVCGYNYLSTIERCYNIGKVTGKKAGGVCGLNNGTITGCYYNSDDIEAAIGEDQSSTVQDCIGKTKKQFASGEVCYLLNGSTSEGESFVWGQTLDNENENENDVSPVFYNKSNKVYYGYKTCGASDPMQYANRELSITTRPAHNYTDNNGFCKVCGSYEPITEKNGVYEISNAGQMYWFAALVNGDTSVDGITEAVPNAKATLTADITVNGSQESPLLKSLEFNEETGEVTNGEIFTAWTPIGSENTQYTGTFDGQGFTISGLYFNNKDTNYVGLFGGIGTNGSVKNINIADSYFKGSNYVGGVCGYNNWGTIENCYNTGTVTGSEQVGGVCGFNGNSVKNCSNTGAVTGTGYWYVGGVCGVNGGTITNCYNTGAVTSSSCYYVGGVCGDNSGGTIESCYSTGKVTGKDCFGGVCGRNKNNTITGTITYSYYNSDTCNTVTAAVGDTEDTETVTGKSTESFTSGEVCYLLNKSMSSGNLAWGQNLSGDNKDNLPVLDNSNTKIVYQYCNAGISYANTQETSTHSYGENGMCACGRYKEPDFDEDTKSYQIKNVGNLYWFASYVNGTLPDDATKHPSANATLVNNITVNEKVLAVDGTLNTGSFKAWTPIGSSKNEYSGTFNGDGKTISGLYFDDTKTSKVGLFSSVGQKGKVEKVNIIDSYFNGNQNIGGVCGYNEGTIERCTVESTVSGNSYVGGVCGFSYQTCAKITYCYNTGAVTGSSKLVGVVGGICGYNEVGEITYCYNTGKVTGSCQHIGGVCGADQNGTIKYCYNTGAVISGHSYVGGVCGQKNGGTIENCYYDSKVCTGKKAVGETEDTENVTGKDTTAFTGGEVCYLLNGSTSESSESKKLVWGQTLVTDASPVFHNGTNTVYYGYVDCNAENKSYGNSELYKTKPEHNHDGANYTCSICKNSMVNIVDFGSPQYKVLSEDSERTFTNVYAINDGVANEKAESITVAANSGLLTVYFKIDDSFKLVKSYKLEVLNSNETAVKTMESKCNTIFANIGMAQLVDTLDAGEYTIKLTLYDEGGAEIRTATTTEKVTVTVTVE